MRMNPRPRRDGLLLAGLALVSALAASCTTHGAAASTSNPTVKAAVVALSQWGQCLIAAGEDLRQTLSTMHGTATADGIVLTFASGDQFLVRNPASSSPVATADNSHARTRIAQGLAREPACHTAEAIPETKAAQLVQPRSRLTG
jgi:hypothetical protein